MKQTFIALAAIVFFGFIEACSQNSGKATFTTSESGLEYAFFEKNEAEAVGYGKIITFQMILKDNLDTVYQDTYKMGTPMEIQLGEPEMSGGIEEGLSMMAIGDSAEFRIKIDSLFKGREDQIPPNLANVDYLSYIVKMQDAMSMEDFQAKREAESLERKEAQDQEIQAYVTEKGLEATSTESGIYYSVIEKGSEERPNISNNVTVHYTGMLLDETVFDSSLPGKMPGKQVTGEPMTYPLSGFIPGWQEGIALMGKGEKAILIIPSDLAYGPQANGQIPANAILVFEVELIDFTN